MSKSWKDYLLRSGLPLENDVRRYLLSRGCTGVSEHSYLKCDEEGREKEFSYDIDAAYIKGRNFVELMIECKYRHDGAMWVFLPGETHGVPEIQQNDVLHPMDHFVGLKFPFRRNFPIHLAPFAGKGIEICAQGDNEKSINEAVAQLSYAFAEKVAGAIEAQVHRSLVTDHIFFHLPIITTTADLLLLRRGVTISEIRDASEVTDIADPVNCLILQNSIGKGLRKHNQGVLGELRESTGDILLQKKLKSFTTQLDHLFEVLASYLCPTCFLVTQFGKRSDAFERMFTYLDEIFSPSPETKAKVREQKRKERAAQKEIEMLFEGSNLRNERATKAR